MSYARKTITLGRSAPDTVLIVAMSSANNKDLEAFTFILVVVKVYFLLYLKR
jgi:hypothetical protein